MRVSLLPLTSSAVLDLLRDQLQSSLGAAYTLERELGGGMAHVYVATDHGLDRTVVIKVLRDDLALELSAERFAREIRLAARLQQANIVPVLSAGSADGRPYYTMPFVEGASLRDRLAAGRLSIDEALGILRDVARALAYAHAHGVIHRDIKPENVLLSGETAVVTDFGIARAVEEARNGMEQSPTLTRVGTLVGTPAYMAPEQAAGETVNARADVYAWGVLAYELLSGAHPFATKRSAYELIAAHLLENPPPLAVPGVPTPVAALVARCLSKRPEDRPADAGALLPALASAPVVTHDVVLSGRTTAPSIAVLPFESLSTDPENQYLADGIADEITNALGKLGGLRVAARTSAFAFRGGRHDVRTVGERLGVATVLEGSVRRAGGRLRVTAQLVDAADGCRMWGERYDRELTDIFAVQDEIATAIASTLEITLGARASGLVRPPTDDVEAYRLYRRAIALLDRRGRALREATTCLEAAIARDPRFAEAHAALGIALANLGFWGGASPAAVLGRAREAAARAQEIAPDLAETHTAAALLAAWYDRDIQAASTAFTEALRLAPQQTQARANYALWTLTSARRDYEAAMSAADRMAADDPLSSYAWALTAIVRFSCGRSGDAVAPAERAVALDPTSFVARVALIYALGWSGCVDESRAAAEEALAVSGRHPYVLSELGMLHGRNGDAARAAAVYAELIARARHEYVAPSDVALAALGAGELNDAYAYAERGLNERDPRIIGIDMEHWVDWHGLRAHPRYHELLVRIGWTHGA